MPAFSEIPLSAGRCGKPAAIVRFYNLHSRHSVTSRRSNVIFANWSVVMMSDDQVNMDKLSSNPAWADAMAKILKQKKPLGRKSVVLSKAKKIQDVKEKEPELDFEIVESGLPEVVHDDEDEEKPITLERKFVVRTYAISF